MFVRTVLGIFVIGSVLAAAGCGPTSAGLKARAEAYDRVDAVNSRLAYDQAKQAFDIAKFDIALREVNGAIARYPKASEYFVLQGRIHLETHRLEHALQSFRQAVEVDEKNAEAHYYAGIVFERWSRDREAFDEYMKAYELEDTKVDYLLAAAEAMIGLGELERAQELVESRLAYFEYNSALRHVLAQIALLMGDPERSAKLYREARVLAPDDLALLEELAWAQFEAGQYAACFDSIKQLQLLVKGERPDLQQLEARCLTAMERLADARTLYMKLTRQDPSEVSMWIELGMVAWELGDYRRVAESSVRVIALTPDRYEGYMLKAIFEHHKGNLEQAVSLMQQATERAEGVAAPYLFLGRLHEENGDGLRAGLAYVQAVEAEPTNDLARSLMNTRVSLAGQ